MMNKVLLLLLMVLVGSCSSNGSGDAGIGDGDGYGYGDLDLGDDFGLMGPEGTRACSQAVVSGGGVADAVSGRGPEGDRHGRGDQLHRGMVKT
jgi:hypothetical protein